MTDAHPSSDVLLERLLRLHPKLIDLELDRMMRILERLENPHLRLPPAVHVAGTNAKGSVIAYMRAALLAAGLRVHVYTSPHLVRFHERIEVDGETIGEEALAALLEECERANGGTPITFFEITTAAAFLAFSRKAADILLLETGLGGRLDATNVIDRPLLTIVTPVSLDHQQFLGESLLEIAGEKAGILKRGVAAVIGPQDDGVLDLLCTRAAALDAPVAVAGRDWEVVCAGDDGLAMRDGGDRLDLPAPCLAGPHQAWNAATAVAALRRLDGFSLAPDALASGLREARWPARLQRLREGRLAARLGGNAELWLDGGHNPAAGKALAEMARNWTDRPLDIVVGMMNTKDPAGFIAPLAPYVRRAVAVAIPGERNSLDARETLAVLRRAGLEAETADDIETAVDRLAECGGTGRRVLLCGSLYLAGKVLLANG